MIRRYLINSGFTNIDQAVDGREGIAMMQQKRYNLISLDECWVKSMEQSKFCYNCGTSLLVSAS